MRFSCYKNDLAEALQFAIKAVAVKPQTPILSGFFLRAEGSTLEIQSNNFYMGIITRIPANVDVAGEVVVSGKRLQEFVRNMLDITLTFTVEDNFLVIKSRNASVELLTMSTSDFPMVKSPAAERSFRMKTTTLRNLIRKTVFAVAKDDKARPVYQGCCFDIKGNVFSMIASDATRVALAREILDETYEDCSFIVPADTLRGIMSRIDPADLESHVMINYAQRYLTFIFDNVFVNTRLIDGAIPPYEKVIPTSSEVKVKTVTEEFKEAIDFVALMSKETEFNTVKLYFSKDKVAISSNSPNVGGAVQEVDVVLEGNDLEISFNVTYIADVLKVAESRQLCIAFNDKYSPAVFTEFGNESYLYIATPVRA